MCAGISIKLELGRGTNRTLNDRFTQLQDRLLKPPTSPEFAPSRGSTFARSRGGRRNFGGRGTGGFGGSEQSMRRVQDGRIDTRRNRAPPYQPSGLRRRPYLPGPARLSNRGVRRRPYGISAPFVRPHFGGRGRGDVSGRGRGGRGRGGRGRGGRGRDSRPPANREQLDHQLDEYMQSSEAMKEDLDGYYRKAREEDDF